MIVGNGNNYYVVLKDPSGNVLAIISDFFSLDYTRIVNNVGQLDLELPVNRYIGLIQPYSTLEVWRSAGGGITSMYLDTETIWIILSMALKLDDSGQLVLHLTALDANDILNTRYVVYYASTAQTSKTGVAGDLMKAVVTENVSASASDYASSTYQGITFHAVHRPGQFRRRGFISMSFSWRKVLTVLQDMAAASTTAGTYMAFDMVADGYNHLEFRTYSGMQRGNDHRLTSNNPIILDPYTGNLAATSLTFRLHQRGYFCLCGRAGDRCQPDGRGTSSNAARLAISPLSRAELFQDARQATDATQVQDAADAALRDNRGLVTYESKIIETPTNRYGIEYKFGDTLPCQFLNQLVDCMLTKVHVSVAGGQETIDVGLQSLN
jgi:hypothetical protein